MIPKPISRVPVLAGVETVFSVAQGRCVRQLIDYHRQRTIALLKRTPTITPTEYIAVCFRPNSILILRCVPLAFRCRHRDEARLFMLATHASITRSQAEEMIE
jgi:hypothetical protein